MNLIKYYLIAIFLFLSTIKSDCQSKAETEICLNRVSKYMLIGVDNMIEFCNNGDFEIQKEDIIVSFTHYKTKSQKNLEILESEYGYYVRPDSLGFIKIQVDTPSGVRTFDLKTKFLTAYVQYLNYYASPGEPIESEIFKSGQGLFAKADGFSGRCSIIDFEIIRIDSSGQVNKLINSRGRFSQESKELINHAISGDLYIFRKLYYKCPGTYLPLILNDMTFEIK